MRLHRKLAGYRTRRPVSETSRAAVGRTVFLPWLYFASGIPALLYQTVWQRVLVLHSGVGTTSVAIIVAAYMLGIGFGSLIGGRVSRGVQPSTALACFALLEAAIGLCALASPLVLYELLYLRWGWLYSDPWLACLLHIATLFIPTSMMGATLPLMTRALVQEAHFASRSVATLYGLNTLGAAFGALLAPWCFLPYLGVVGAVSVGVAINFVVAAIALAIRSQMPPSTESPAGREKKTVAVPGATPSADASPPLTVWMTLYFFSGFCAIGLEILWFRMLDVAVKSASFTFGTVLAIYLAGIALGSIVGAYRVERITDPLRAFVGTQCWILAFAASSVLAILYCPPTWVGASWFMELWAAYDLPDAGATGLGSMVVLYLLFPLFLMGPSTLLMGYSFSVLQRGVQRDAASSGYRVGVLQAANIAGCTVGSLLVGLWLVGAAGTLDTLRGTILLGIVFAVVGIAATSARWRFAAGSAALAVVAWLLPEGNQLWRRLHGVDRGQGYVAEDVTGVAALAPEPDGQRWRLSANGKGQSHLPFGGVHSKLGTLPATLHPAPRTIAIIGLGSGDTAWAASCRVETRNVTIFEICSAEKALLTKLAAGGGWPQLQQFIQDPRIRFDGRDGRHVLMTEATTYDVIEADAIRPHGAYGGYLYSIEFFQLCARRLNPGGLMCSWSPTPRTHATFREAFPHVLELDQSTVLIGSNQPIELDLEHWRDQIRSPSVADYLGPEVVQECLGSMVNARILPAPSGVPRKWINTDLFPFDEFHP